MFYYYVVKLTDNYNTIDKKIINKYIRKKKFRSLADENLLRLAAKTGKPFIEVIRNVFRAYVSIEHKAEKMAMLGENIYPDNEFASYYFDLIKDKIKPSDKDKIYDLGRVHEEDIRFMKQRNDNFHTYLSNDPEVNNDQVVILLDEKKFYLGHIYIWSWLSSSRNYSNLYTLKFAGIRTSVYNLIKGTVKGVSSLFVNIIGEWAMNHGYKYMEIGLPPMGTMGNNLKVCGSSDKYIIKIKDIMCKESRNYLQLKASTDIFGNDNFLFDKWYSKVATEDKEVVKGTWFESSNIHKLFRITYPDKNPSAEDLEKIYILTFNGMKNYYVGGITPLNVQDELIKISKSLKEKKEDLLREEREHLERRYTMKREKEEKEYLMTKNLVEGSSREGEEPSSEESSSSEDNLPKKNTPRDEKEDNIIKIMISLFRIKEQFDYTVLYYNNLDYNSKSGLNYESLIGLIKRIRDDFYYLASLETRYGGITDLRKNIKHRLMIF
jgi:hypothetical protein